ncbi:MAG: hypothetical protein GY803_19340, partial [Chloroflexi bacterium]|nr:hypothetical protein [Chloroflexota bacterium]
TWNAGRETLQRIVFFQNRAGRLLRLPTAPPNYWGAQWRNEHPWGTLVYYGVDETWAEEVADFVAETVEQVCADVCLESQLPIVLTMAEDYGETAAGGQLRFPSPRLVALDAKGDPAPLYWELLRQQIVRYLTPATIRFAVPPLPNYTNYGGLAIYNYQTTAAEFMATHPNITIEIVPLTELPDDLAVLATDFDGAAASPTEEMLAAGLVHDLTDYIATDLAFDQVDFYKQIWQGVRWQERIWWMPQAANMR